MSTLGQHGLGSTHELAGRREGGNCHAPYFRPGSGRQWPCQWQLLAWWRLGGAGQGAAAAASRVEAAVTAQESGKEVMQREEKEAAPVEKGEGKEIRD